MHEDTDTCPSGTCATQTRPVRPRPRGWRAWVAPVLGFAGLMFAAWGWANEYYIGGMWPALHVDSLLLSRYSEILVIAVFGVWRVAVEPDPPTRKRIATLVVLVSTMWGAIPLLIPFVQPHIGAVPWAPEFPSVHVPGAFMYFVWLTLIFLFGRRVDCSWCCPCVGIRETAGQPFRRATIKGPPAWALRHVKWIFLAMHVVYAVLLFIPGQIASSYFAWFWMVVPLSYYASFFLVPVMGNRNYCRYICPFGAVYGVVAQAGFFRIEAEADRCSGCARCDDVCDMGVPVARLVQTRGVIDIPDCVGCGRCADACPKDVLHLLDVRDSLGIRAPRPGTDLVRSSK